jgi:hypothetical protein
LVDEDSRRLHLWTLGLLRRRNVRKWVLGKFIDVRLHGTIFRLPLGGRKQKCEVINVAPSAHLNDMNRAGPNRRLSPSRPRRFDGDFARAERGARGESQPLRRGLYELAGSADEIRPT